MSVLIAIVAGARNLPWQVWAIAALALGVGLYGCSQYDAGGDSARIEIQRSNEKARSKADEGQRSVANCDGDWDRARGLCVPDDGAGR